MANKRTIFPNSNNILAVSRLKLNHRHSYKCADGEEVYVIVKPAKNIFSTSFNVLALGFRGAWQRDDQADTLPDIPLTLTTHQRHTFIITLRGNTWWIVKYKK